LGNWVSCILDFVNCSFNCIFHLHSQQLPPITVCIFLVSYLLIAVRGFVSQSCVWSIQTTFPFQLYSQHFVWCWFSKLLVHLLLHTTSSKTYLSFSFSSQGWPFLTSTYHSYLFFYLLNFLWNFYINFILC
jgi:hypothetical protein